MTNYEYLRSISAPRLAIILGDVADSNPKEEEYNSEACCPLKKIGKCRYGEYDCCEVWAMFLMEEMTPEIKKFWHDLFDGEIMLTQEICDRARIEKRKDKLDVRV